MKANSRKFRIVFASLLLFILVSCNSGSAEKEPTLISQVVSPSPSPSEVVSPSPSPTVIRDLTPDNVEEEQTEAPGPTAQVLGEPMIAPTVDINDTNINLKQELYFTGGAEQGDSLAGCTRSLFEKYDVSFESEQDFIINGITPPELDLNRFEPYFEVELGNRALALCIYGFPKNETITVELYTPENNLCAFWEVLVSDYYYYTIGDITMVDFAKDWPLCSLAGQWSVVVKSASVSLAQLVEIDWYNTFNLSSSNLCDSSNAYVSVKGSGYPPREPRFLGVYGACYPTEKFGYPHTACKLLQSYVIRISDEGLFDVLVPANLPGEYIVVPVKKDEPPAGGFNLILDPGIVLYPGTCSSPRDLYLTTPTLEGEDVEDIQQQLRALGYFEVGPVDGIFGPKTESAVLLFQQTNELEVNGIVNETTRNALFGDDAISRPHTRNLNVTTPRLNGDDVVAVQQRLIDLGYVEVGEIDGYYGPKTESTVLRFQNMNGLPESGTVDEQTWNAIFSRAAIPGW